jgi:hypothetical protein
MEKKMKTNESQSIETELSKLMQRTLELEDEVLTLGSVNCRN